MGTLTTRLTTPSGRARLLIESEQDPRDWHWTLTREEGYVMAGGRTDTVRNAMGAAFAVAFWQHSELAS